MILEFSCSNYKSIKERIEFSMLAGSDTSKKENCGIFNDNKILRSAVIYGANGSGKSNFLDALAFMCGLVSNSINNQPGDVIQQRRHKLNTSDAPSEFRIQFVQNNVRYAYGFVLKENKVESEFLYYFPNNRRTKLFERDLLKISAGSKYKSAFSTSMQTLKENRLFLSCAANNSDIDEVTEAFLFFRKQVVFYKPSSNNWIERSIELMEKNKEIKKSFVDVLKAFGTGIKDIKPNIKLKDNFSDIQMPNFITTMIGDNDIKQVNAKIVYESFEVDLLREESDGIKRLFELLCPIIDIINNGRVLICDEIESNLHEILVAKIIELFQKTKEGAIPQLIFTTHDTSLLSANLFRRDQIWFTELREDRSTDLYSLAEIRNVRKTENLALGYVNGRYGAIPMLNDGVFQKLTAERDDNGK